MKITVLGTGLVGHAIVKDLVKEETFYVTAVDINEANLSGLQAEPRVTCVRTDFRDLDRVDSLIQPSDLVQFPAGLLSWRLPRHIRQIEDQGSMVPRFEMH